MIHSSILNGQKGYVKDLPGTFKGNAQKASKFSYVVPSNSRYEFKQMCQSLLGYSLEFYQFEVIAKKICSMFPKAKGW